MESSVQIWVYTVMFASFLSLLHYPNRLLAHEGHASLPSKGVLIDQKNGRITLALASRNGLGIETTEVIPGMLPAMVPCPGSIELPWNQHALVSSPLAGRITLLPVRSGTFVRKGQLLAKLECPALVQLLSDLRGAALDLQIAKQLVKSTEEAATSGAIAGVRLLESKNQAEQARTAIRVLSAKWQSFDLPDEILAETIENPEQKQSLVPLPIYSPIDGYVTHVDLAVGKYVPQNEHLFEILDLKKVWLKIRVLESNLSKLALGQRVRFRPVGAPDVEFESTIDCIDRSLDPLTHEGIAWSTLDNPANPSRFRLKPGMSVVSQVRIEPARESLLVPSRAILRDGRETAVIVEEELSKRFASYRRVNVTLGNENEERTACEIITRELVPGDRVVTQGGYHLHHLLPHLKHLNASSYEKITTTRIAPSLDSSKVFRDDSISFTGTFEVPANHRSTVSSLLDGTIAMIYVDRSQEVQKGDLIAELRSPAFHDLQLDFLQTHLRTLQLQTNLENLVGGGVAVPERQRIEAEGLLMQTKTRLNSIRDRLFQLGLSQTELQHLISHEKVIPNLAIHAPISGTIIGFDQFLGKNIQSDQQLLTIQNLTHGMIQGYLPESKTGAILPEQRVLIEFTAIPNEVFSGSIARTSEAILPEDQTQRVWIELSTSIPALARPGMLAIIRLQSPVPTTLKSP